MRRRLPAGKRQGETCTFWRVPSVVTTRGEFQFRRSLARPWTITDRFPVLLTPPSVARTVQSAAPLRWGWLRPLAPSEVSSVLRLRLGRSGESR